MWALAPLQYRRICLTKKALGSATSGSRGQNSLVGDDSGKWKRKDLLYLHIGPGGDSWTGTSLFAAKHLQPDYVKSVMLPEDFEEGCMTTEALLQAIDQDAKLQRQIYDEQTIPPSLLEKARVTR